MAIKSGRRAIYISNNDKSSLHRLLEMRGDDTISETMETAVGRYLDLISKNCPDFSDAEWCLVFDALAGLQFDEPSDRAAIGQEVQEAIDIDSLHEKWNVDADEIKEKLTALTYTEKQVVAEMTEMFRTLQTEGIPSYSKAISSLKQKLVDNTPAAPRTPRRMSPDRI